MTDTGNWGLWDDATDGIPELQQKEWNPEGFLFESLTSIKVE